MITLLFIACGPQANIPQSVPTPPIPGGQNIIPVNATKIFSDKLHNLFALTTDNDLIKFDKTGKERYRMTNYRAGDLAYLDTTNPLKLLAFYPAFQKIHILDNTLSLTYEFNLLDLNFQEVSAVAMSNDNHIWIYDDIDFKLKKIKADGSLLAASDDLSLRWNRSLNIVQILERNNRVYLVDTTSGILVFDQFGQFDESFEMQGVQHLQVLDETLILRKVDQYLLLDPQTTELKNWKHPTELEAPIACCFEHEKTFCLYPNYVRILKQ